MTSQKKRLLSEFVSQIMLKKKVSVRKLAKQAGLSPTIIQAMRSGSKKDFNLKSFFKVLEGLGCKKLMAEIDGKIITIKILH